MDTITFTRVSTYNDVDGEVRTETTTNTISGEILTHMDITDVFIDFLRGSGYILNELRPSRFD